MIEIQPLLRSTSEAVQWNCDLLNAAIGRVNLLEVWTKVAEPQVAESTKFVDEHYSKLSELTGFGDQIKSAFASIAETYFAITVHRLDIYVIHLQGALGCLQLEEDPLRQRADHGSFLQPRELAVPA